MIIWGLEENANGVLLAMIACLAFDFLDGFVARTFNLQHSLGGELDSLADMISFGVAPAVLLYILLGASGLPAPWQFVAFGFTVCAALRLAKFNVETRSGNHFFGLPSPAAAAFFFGLYVLYSFGECAECQTIFLNQAVLITSLIVVSLLMVSDLPHISFKFANLKWRGNEIRWIYLLLCIVLIFLLKEAAISSLIVLYILLSLAYYSFISTNRQ